MTNRLSDYDYDLPEGQIALRPLEDRASARLLVASKVAMREAHVGDLPNLLRKGDLLVINTTRVLPARLTGRRLREGASAVEIDVTLLTRKTEAGEVWSALVRPLRKLTPGDEIAFGALSATFLGREGDQAILRFGRDAGAFAAGLAEAGRMPLPPYIEAKRKADVQDLTDYQPLWAKQTGAVAAPTASLHFDQALIAALQAKGVNFAEVVLHVGAGTFLPVKTEDLSAHVMHAEWGEVSAETVAKIEATRAAGGRVIAVGTTALRVLESAAQSGVLKPFRGETAIFIREGHVFRAVDGLWTNFHQPRSTLLILISALMGRARVLELYGHAVASGYRFLSYGDACLFLPEAEELPP